MPIEIQAKSALHKLKSDRYPYKFDLNIYRGCFHRCAYCYAVYSHKYLQKDSNMFFHDIYVKTNILKLLEERLKSKRWKKAVINLGGVTDSYQPAEKKYKLTRGVLELFLKYQNPLVISTKSDLILRDYDLISELSKKTDVTIAFTVTTLDKRITKKIEPFAASPKKRLQAAYILKQTNAFVGIHMMPILPCLTDNKDNLQRIFKNCSKLKMDYLLTSFLNLKSDTKKYYLNFLKNEFPNIYSKYLNLYKSAHLDKNYKKNINKRLFELRQIYKIPFYKAKHLEKKPKKSLKRQIALNFPNSS